MPPFNIRLFLFWLGLNLIVLSTNIDLHLLIVGMSITLASAYEFLYTRSEESKKK